MDSGTTLRNHITKKVSGLYDEEGCAYGKTNDNSR